MKKNITLKSIFTASLLILFISISLFFKTNSVYAIGSFTCFMGEGNVWEARGIEGCGINDTTDVDQCQGLCEADTGVCDVPYGSELTGSCVPVTQECSSGSIANDFDDRCVCSPPKTIVGGRTGSGNLYCVGSCLSGSTVYNNDNDNSPSCLCSSRDDMSINDDGVCVSDNAPVPPTPPETGGGNEPGALEGTGGGGGTVTRSDFDALNPLKQAARTPGTGNVSETLTTPGAIISRILEFAFPLAGFILFIMLFWGGFEILYGSSTSKSMEAGKNRITAAIIGFFLLFASFWIIQILQEILGIESFLS